MPKVFLFDLDMTLVDSSAVEPFRRSRRWGDVRANLDQVVAFKAGGSVAPHDLPGALKDQGHTVGIVTSSPRWYAQSIAKTFGIRHDVLVGYEDTTNHKPDAAPLLKALELLRITANKHVYYIGDDVNDIEAAYHAGIKSIGIRWSPVALREMPFTAPDIFLSKPSSLLREPRHRRLTYIGERITSDRPYVSHWGSVLRNSTTPEVYALGRYFTASDPRHSSSSLSAAILRLKNHDDPSPRFSQALAEGITQIGWTPDYIVPVPPKPSQNRNRFESVLKAAEGLLSADIKIKLKGLSCVKEVDNYKQMGHGSRAAAISGAFRSNYTWKGLKILLLDDVFTSGSTTDECTRTLLSNGAKEVRSLVLGRDQRAFINKICSCGRSMRIRTNGSTGNKFWGCSGYPSFCQNTSNL